MKVSVIYLEMESLAFEVILSPILYPTDICHSGLLIALIFSFQELETASK